MHVRVQWWKTKLEGHKDRNRDLSKGMNIRSPCSMMTASQQVAIETIAPAVPGVPDVPESFRGTMST